MTEFLVIGLTIAMVLVLPKRRWSKTRTIIAVILLVAWAPVVALGIRDLAPLGFWKALFWGSPVALLFIAPFICLWLRYRKRRTRNSAVKLH
ncbi:MAG: hypothetical protein JO097_13680 [Acidobacteriaceae bacterium]|nr:hypothetical protein [Acidobacteriaceae bacterium]MBV9295240.1 hypothetical protein [Acidobacteriaceae bacterium]MBV9767450.1 hypothetical protein [Acidobacteriaceae bacterium]